MLQKIQKLADKYGIFIEHEFKNQEIEGNKDLRSITCTVSLYKSDYEFINSVSKDTLDEALSEGIELATKYLRRANDTYER